MEFDKVKLPDTNPDRDPAKPCVYGGMSDKVSSVVKRYGIRVLPELYAHLNPMPFEAAAQMEQDLAEDLRRTGYTVTGGH
jgi:hypothetical protein